MADEPRQIKSGDDEYDFVFGLWEKNGRPAQFDYESSAGGAIYHVIDRHLDQPTFSVWAEGPGELWDDEVDGDMPVRVGFGQHTNRTGRFKLFLQGPARNQRLLARTEAPIRERTDLT
ncbi:MAG: hypothetical protein XU15_C0011G0131 [candidate division NC10 bacterium CSP1-5]|nr:MAG: hypothetical protein XU15_C0011G0131 [candidate division NC10 bacterium CSP1-5]